MYGFKINGKAIWKSMVQIGRMDLNINVHITNSMLTGSGVDDLHAMGGSYDENPQVVLKFAKIPARLTS